MYIQVEISYIMGAIYDAEQEQYILAEKVRLGKLNIQNEDMVHKTISFTISEWALVQQIVNKNRLKNLTQGMRFCIHNTAIEEGLETV